MATAKEIPLIVGSQKFRTAINGVPVNMVITWRGDFYTLDLTNNVGTIRGIRLTTGCNLLEQYAHMGYTSPLVLNGEPTYSNLGIDSHLVSIE